jgi:hypothetical protein
MMKQFSAILRNRKAGIKSKWRRLLVVAIGPETVGNFWLLSATTFNLKSVIHLACIPANVSLAS